MYYELSPAYGRDYKSGKDAIAAFNAGQDFEGDFNLGFKPVSKTDLAIGSGVNLRYCGNRKVAVTTVRDHELIPLAPKAPRAKPVARIDLDKWAQPK